MSEFEQKIRKIHLNTGAEKPTPKQIAEVIKRDDVVFNKETLEKYLPTKEDIREKGIDQVRHKK